MTSELSKSAVAIIYHSWNARYCSGRGGNEKILKHIVNETAGHKKVKRRTNFEHSDTRAPINIYLVKIYRAQKVLYKA